MNDYTEYINRLNDGNWKDFFIDNKDKIRAISKAWHIELLVEGNRHFIDNDPIEKMLVKFLNPNIDIDTDDCRFSYNADVLDTAENGIFIIPYLLDNHL